MDAGARGRRLLQRREYKAKVSEFVPKELEDHVVYENPNTNLFPDGTQEKVKKFLDKGTEIMNSNKILRTIGNVFKSKNSGKNYPTKQEYQNQINKNSYEPEGEMIEANSEQMKAMHDAKMKKMEDDKVAEKKKKKMDEACWKGYEKKGMKTMFGKRYPNCVKKKAKKEDFSNWRDDLSDIVEVMDMTDDKAEKKIDDKKTVKNKVIINPKLSEAVRDMGGELLEVTELEGDQLDELKLSDKEKEGLNKSVKAAVSKAAAKTGLNRPEAMRFSRKEEVKMKGSQFIEAMSSYDRARKAAAKRAAARNAERKAGTRGGRMERETYRTEMGVNMHHKGYKAEAYTVNQADKTGNTPAYQGYKAGKKNKLTGEPLYKKGNMKEGMIDQYLSNFRKKLNNIK